MSQLFKRRVQVAIGTVLIEGLRVQFHAQRSLLAVPNTLELRINNLSEATRDSLPSGIVSGKNPTPVVVMAGYQDGPFGQIFSGTARTIDHERRKADWITLVRSGDFEATFQFGYLNESMAPGASLADAVKRIATKLGVDATQALKRIGKGDLRGGVTRFLSGLSIAGDPRSQLGKLLESAGFEWSIQDKELVVLKKGEAVNDGEAPLFTPTTGLIGSPTFMPPQQGGLPPMLKVKTLMHARLRPGRAMKIISESIKAPGAVYRVERVTHSGDTHGQDWYTESECSEMKGYA